MKKMTILGAATVMCCVSAMASGGEDGNFFESLWNRLFSDKNSVSMENSKSSPHEHHWHVTSVDTVNCQYSHVFIAYCGERVSYSSSSYVTLMADPDMIDAGFPATFSFLLGSFNAFTLDMQSGYCYNSSPHHGQGNGSQSCLVFVPTSYVKTIKQCAVCQAFEYEYEPGNYTNLKPQKKEIVTKNCNGPKHQEGGDV